MKKTVCILLLGLYTIFNIGLVVNTHFCGGKLDSISVFSKKDKICGFCGKGQMANNCCKDIQTQLLVDDSQISSRTTFDLSPLFVHLSILQPLFIKLTNYTSVNKNNFQFCLFKTGPPKTPIYIQVHSLLI